MIDPTLSESCLKNSIKKFFVDSLVTGEGIHLDFDVQYVQPEDVGVDIEKWISIKFGTIEGGNLAKSHLIVYLFTRKDAEGVDLSLLRDIVLDKITDLDATDGTVKIPFYNSSWVQIGGIVPILSIEMDEPSRLGDGTKYKWMRINLHWGAK